jgi:hypothetical protein
MKRSIFKKGGLDILRSAVVPILFSLVVMGLIVYGLRQTEESSRAEGLRILEESIHRAVLTAYAIEGRYPDSIAYVEENYGIHIDRTKYIVYYDIFASNLLPNIMVIDIHE